MEHQRAARAALCRSRSGTQKIAPRHACLQEVYRDPKSGRGQAELIADMCGLTHFVEESGLAIFCSQPVALLNSAALPQFAGDPPRYVILAEFLIEGRALLVINTHLAYRPEMIEGRRKQVEALLAAVRAPISGNQGSRKFFAEILMTLPGFSPAIRAVLNSDEKFIDVFAQCHPNDRGFTYSPRNQYVERSWTLDERIDYIFMSRDLMPKDCAIVFDGNNGLDFASDHFGLFCRLEFLQ